MGVEIEKKFLILSDAWRMEVVKSIPMRQGYLTSGASYAVRVRIAGDRAWLTIKGERVNGATPEFEYEIPANDAAEMLKLVTGPLIEKTRYIIPYAGKNWEIDEFSGANHGLVLAEIELESLDDTAPPPPWLGREVTGEKRFYNAHLVSYPFKDWADDEKH